MAFYLFTSSSKTIGRLVFVSDKERALYFLTEAIFSAEACLITGGNSTSYLLLSSELDYFEANNAVLSFGRFYHGIVDEIMIFNRVLEGDEITVLFDQFGTSSNSGASIQEQISVQPNPTSDYVDIKVKGLEEIRLIDLNGQTTKIDVYSIGELHRIPLDGFKSGLYAVLLVGTDEELLGIKKIVIQD